MSNQGEQDGAPMICAQCHFTKHDEEAEFCFRCGGVLVDLQSLPQIPGGPDASPSSMNSNSSSSSSSIIPSSPGSASTAVHAIMDKLEPSTKASIDFSVHLWDCSDKAFAKSRDSKHTARGMASFFAELSKIEKTYAAALAKLAAGTDYGSAIEANEIKPVDQSTVIRAWNSVKADVISRSTSHANFSEALSSKVEVSLTELRKTLSSRKEKLESMVIDAQQEMKRALENHAKFKVKYEKLQADLASKGPSGKLTQADVSQACDVATQAQMVVFQTQNNYNRTVSENLTRIQELELERLDLTRRILFQARMAQSEMERKYLRSESAEYQSISSIDPVKEVSRWIEMNKSMNACPWASQKDPHSSISAVQANAAANVGKNIFAIAGREAEPVSVSSSSSSAATTSPTIAAGVSGANEAAAEASKPRPTVRRRGSRSNSAQVSAETAALLHSSNPIINELALPPSNAVSALPAGIGMTDIPFPSLSDGANKSMEPLPTTPWMPTVRALFPMEVASGLPEIRHLQLDDSEYNRMIYEQLLLGTKLLSGVEASSQLDTIVQVVRVQLQITQGEHDLLLLLLNSEQSHTAAMPKSVPAPTKEVYDSMKFVNYRINLLKNTRSSKFSSLQLYCKWFQRQLMAIWLSIMWSMAMEAQESSAAAAPGGSSGSQPTLSLLRFKQNLQVVQLLGFCLQSRIETKLFVFGDSVKSGGHDDLVAQLDSLEQTLNSFPRAEKKSGGLTYPQAFLNKAYQHLLKMALVSGGDDAGRPIVSEKRKKALLKKKKAAQKAANKKNNNQHAGEEDDDEEEEEEKENDDEEEDEEDEITEDEDEDDDDESQIELNDNYATIIASLSSVRTAWHISSFVHHVSTLSVCLHLMYYQSQDYDGRLLDAEGMLTEDEHSLLPLIISSTEGIAGRLSTSDSKAHGLSSALQKEAGTKPSGGYHSEEYKWLFYGLRNISMALSDFHKFPAAPVVACLSFYYDVTHWLGVKDSAKRVENLLRISTTTFYQTLIPTEQIISFNGALGGGDRRKSKENSLQVPEKFARPSGGSMKLEAKKMLNWTSMEWKRYTQKLANFVREQIEDLFPLLAKNKSLAAVFGSGGGSASSSSSAAKKGKADKQKNPFDSEEDDDENSGEEGEEEGKRGSTHSRPSSASSSSSKMNGAELCVTHILRCFQHDVHLLTADRKAQTSIMDDTLFSLVNSSMKLQSVLLDGDYHAFWSGEGVRITVGTVFPNLQELCASNLKRWISVQRVKVEGIRERCVSLDTWSAMDMASGLRYSHSVKDLFNFLSTVEEAFWAHARSMQGYGVSDSFPVLFDLFQSTMIQYALQIVETAGLDVMNSLLPTKDVKLKMAKIEPDSKDKAKAFMKGLFKSKEEKEEEESQVTPLPVSKGLVLQTIPSLCVRLNSIQAAIDNTEELTSSIRSHLQAFVDDCPIVAPPNSDKSTMDAYNRAQKRWSSWTPHFKPPTRLQRMDGENLFTDAAEQMEHSIDTLSNGIGFAKVYIDWRHAWLERLYKPQPTYSNRIKEGEIEVQIEESMPIIHGSVDRKLFPLVARHIFTHLLDAIEYTLLYGRRCMPEDSVRNIVNDDIAQLLTLFGHACPKSQLEDICKELQAVCQTMESVSSEDLISAYQSQKAPNNLTLAKVARILATRNNKNAQKFCDKLRGK